MSISQRHSELFAAQDWRLIHEAFSKINFNSYDYDSIRTAMVEYIRTNYPEEFSDWIETSEFVALIDLLSYLGGILAFRTDINAQENFLDTATARESILRLARILSYVPRRNYPARGLLKVTKVSSNDDIIDSNGTNLNSAVIYWNDPQNPDWNEQWNLILNTAFSSTNKIDSPLKKEMIDGIQTQLYRFNSLAALGSLYSFTSRISGKSYRFEIVNSDFSQDKGFFEKTPDPHAATNIIYRNDGDGNSSPNTGFFFYFKQGELKNKIFNFEIPEENRVLDIPEENINELDIWVQSIYENERIMPNGIWQKVPSVDGSIYTGDNISFNNIDIEKRNIYSVITRDKDSVSLRFSDGRFGTIPQGLMKVWYRTSSGNRYTIRPQDISDVDITIPYVNDNTGIIKSITLTLSLQYTVSNSVPRETDEDIRRRAPSVYYTQNRMVSGEDYQNFPTQNNLARKIKALNRTYSGHSRYIDLNDPTGNYQNVNVFSDDGIIYEEYSDQYFEMAINNNINRTTTSILNEVIQPFIQNVKMKNFVWDKFLFIDIAKPVMSGNNTGPWILWQQASGSNQSSTGTFRKLIYDTTPVLPEEDDLGGDPFPGINQTIGPSASVTASPLAKLMTEECLVKFKFSGWVSINSISGDGAGIVNDIGRVRLANPVKTNDYVVQVLPTFRTTLDEQERNIIIETLNGRRSFGIGYDYITRKFYIIDGNRMKYNSDYDYSSKNSDEDSSWLISVEYSSDMFRIVGRGLIYTFESTRDCRFYVYNEYKQFNQNTGLMEQDFIDVLNINKHPSQLLTTNWKANTGYMYGSFVLYRNTVYQCVYDDSREPEDQRKTKMKTFSTFNGTTLIWEPVSPSLDSTKKFKLVKPYTYKDGYIEPRRIEISFFDSDDNGIPDNPEIFYDITGLPKTYTITTNLNKKDYTRTYIDENSPQLKFWEKYIHIDNYEYYRPTDLNPLRIRKAFTTYVDIESPNKSTVVITYDSNNRPIYNSSTVIPQIYRKDGGIPNGGLVLLAGQTQFEDTVERKAENFKVYRYDATANDEAGKLIEVTDITEWLLEHSGEKLEKIGTLSEIDANIIYDFSSNQFWIYETSDDTEYGDFYKDENSFYLCYRGRNDLKFHWKHLAPRDHRIDPAVTNIIDIFVLTTQYDIELRNWIRTNKPLSEKPEPPSELDLRILFSDLENYKMFSDELVWRPVKYKLLFGSRADEMYKAKFKVVRLETTTLSDGEIKAQVINAINEYFSVSWDFGDTFYVQDLTAYIIPRLANIIASFVIVPLNENFAFGNLFEIPMMPDEIPISVASVDDVSIIKTNTQTNLRIKY